MNILRLLIPICLACAHCLPQEVPRDRQPAVAGQFYPSTKQELQTTVRELLAQAGKRRSEGILRALIAPHAGYVFSGKVAATSFNQIPAGTAYQNVFLLGSSHRVAFSGASVYSRGDYLTPLGRVPVNRQVAAELCRVSDLFSSREDAHAGEHSLEVELPFLQEKLGASLRIVPIVIGTDDPAVCRRIAGALAKYFTPENLFVVSTDFSHYPAAAEAPGVDNATADAILTGSPEMFLVALRSNASRQIPGLATSACGWTSLLVLMDLAERAGDMKFLRLEYRNSGMGEAGDPSRVVGYHAISLVQRSTSRKEDFSLSLPEKKELLRIARRTIEEYITARRLPEFKGKQYTEGALATPCGAFVTLRKEGLLRGCIGRFTPSDPLWRVVQEMAVAASTEDHRFEPVSGKELPALEVEISVLTPLRKISSPDEIQMGKHGIYMVKGGRSGTFLPQVASETGWSREEFLGHCAQDKAGLGWEGWKDADLFVYEALVFSESEVLGK